MKTSSLAIRSIPRPALAPDETMEMSFTSERIQAAFSTRGESRWLRAERF